MAKGAGFIDKAHIYCCAGNGGNGCNSFYRDRYARYPKRDGGDGGDGGDVIITADKGLSTLLDFQYINRFKAGKGAHGSGNSKKGIRGNDCVINIPVGTVIRDAGTNNILRDLTTEGEKVIVAEGGKGGSGNRKVQDSLPGEGGQSREIYLELKLIADVGIIGYPNAGKSTLISRISSARSKVASYPFTTIAPVLGVVKLNTNQIFVACDIPGLIKDAHSGKGLGFEFLRHIERTRVLLHLIDMSAADRRDPSDDYISLNEELNLYNPSLLDKPQILAANKMDLPQSQGNLKSFRARIKEKIHPISCITGEGVEELLKAMTQYV